MKNRFLLITTLLAFALSTLAQEPNPFVKRDTKIIPPGASGDSFVNLIEHILVPADQLDAWLEKHPLGDDASALRTAAQIWLTEGSGRLDQTALSTGTAGREFHNNSIWEQSYATEYMPTPPGEWPFPTSFDTINLGYSASGGAGIEDGAMLLRAKMEFCGMMLPHHSWNKLAERTRLPDDVFIPRFRIITAERLFQDANGNQPQEDPFAEPSPEPAGARDLRFDPNKTYLASRADNDLPEPTVGKNPDLQTKSMPLPPNHLVRLIFFRGTILSKSAPAPQEPADIQHLSIKLIQVKHRILSDWIQTNDLAQIPDLAWDAAKGWLEDGSAETITDLTGTHHPGSTCVIEDRQEVVYPTEWEPGKRSPATDGKPSQPEFSDATAFDTRNVGTMLGAQIVSDLKGSILKFGLKRVVEGGKSVHHRIFRDGEWKADATFPIFSTNAWESELRAKRGVWMLVGSGSDVDGKGKLDPEQAVLAFIRLD